MPATHRNSPMKCFLPTEASSEIFLTKAEKYNNFYFQDLISVELKTKQSGISTKTTPATVDLQVTTVCPTLTSPPTLSCNPSNPQGSYSSSITSGSWKHQPYQYVVKLELCTLQTAGRTTLCSIMPCSIVSAVKDFCSRQPSLSSDTIKTAQASPGSTHPGWVYVWNAAVIFAAICLGGNKTFKWYSWFC